MKNKDQALKKILIVETKPSECKSSYKDHKWVVAKLISLISQEVESLMTSYKENK